MDFGEFIGIPKAGYLEEADGARKVTKTLEATPVIYLSGVEAVTREKRGPALQSWHRQFDHLLILPGPDEEDWGLDEVITIPPLSVLAGKDIPKKDALEELLLACDRNDVPIA